MERWSRMLKKDELRKLRTLRATPAMIAAAKDNDVITKERMSACYGTYTREYLRKYGYFLRCQNLGAFLKIAVFFSIEINKGQMDPHYEVFINPETGEYITRELTDGVETNWIGNMIDNLKVPYKDYSYQYHCRKLAWINTEGKATLKRMLESNSDDALNMIRYWQSRMRQEKRNRNYDKNIEKWEKEVAAPELTDAMKTWIKREVVTEHYMFYKYDRKGVKEGFCTYCEKKVPLPEKYKNNLKTVCPTCGKKIELKSIGNRKQLWTHWHRGTIMQYAEDGRLIIRLFSVRNCMVLPFEEVGHVAEEVYRFTFDGDKVQQYEYGNYKKYKTCWHPAEYPYYYSFNCGKVYKMNFRSLSNGILKRSGLLEMIRKNKLGDTAPYKWLSKEAGNPLLEQLVKLKMYRLAKEVADARYDSKFLNESATNPAEILKLDKSRLKRLRGFGKQANIHHVKWLQYEKNQNTQYADDLIDFYAKNEIIYYAFNFLPVKMGFIEIRNYLTKQSLLSHDSVHQVVDTWRDYLEMAKKLKMQITVEQIYKPSNLAQRHTAVREMMKTDDMKAEAKKLEKKWPEVNTVLKGLQKYRYTDEEYIITTPANVYDVVREGTLLSHCIHTVDYYWDRITRRETYIFFLRKASNPDAPWYTLEVEPGGAIRQKRTTGDNQNPDLKPAEPFLKKWQKEIKKVLTDEDIRLAEESEKLRKKGYAELRKKGERIRRGKLAGQLLADVLEKDFMAAI